MKFLFLNIFLFYMLNILNLTESLIKPIINKKYLIPSNNDISCGEKNSLVFTDTKKYFKDKKVISLNTEGYYGFYLMGICSYIKENYNISDYKFLGSSAGAWNALYMTLKSDPKFMINTIVKNDIYKNKNIFQIDYEIKDRILQYYKTNEFDLDKLFISVSTFGQTNIYTDFENLEDAIDCCIASSYIPYVTGSIIHKYKNKIFTGEEFEEYPYLNKDTFFITKSIWNWNRNEKLNFLNLEKLYEKGYSDTLDYGNEILDKQFTDMKKNIEIN